MLRIKFAGDSMPMTKTICSLGIMASTLIGCAKDTKLVEEKHSHKGYIVSRQSGTDQLETIQLSNVSLQLEGATASGR